MEITVEKLEALINQADALLNTAALELEIKLRKETGMQFNPVKLIHSVQEMACELDKLKQDADILMKKQEDVKQKLGKELPEICKKLQDIEDQSGFNHNSAASSTIRNRFDNLHL